MKQLLPLLLLLAGCASDAEDPRAVPETETTYLFDGQSFEGWNGNMEWFRIEDGAIVAGTTEKPIPNNEFLCTDQEYDDYELRFQTRLVGDINTNAGVQIHTQRIPDDHEVIGYQADIGLGWWGSLYDEMRRNTLLATADRAVTDSLVQHGNWVHYTVRTEGARTQLFLRGVQTIDYTEPDSTIPLSGHICVQIHSGPPGEAWYRDIRIEEL